MQIQPQHSKHCYFCGKKKASREHVPPKCFFSEEARANLKGNLITVWSCDAHNNEKSGVDEYMLQLLAGINNTGNAATDPSTKYLTSKATQSLLKARTKCIAPTIFNLLEKNHKTPKIVLQMNSANKFAQNYSVSVEIDEKRVFSFLESVGRGILNKKYKIVWEGHVQVFPHFLIGVSSPRNLREISEGFLKIFDEKNSEGVAPHIFYYEVSDFNNGNYSVDLCFFRQFKATCFFKLQST